VISSLLSSTIRPLAASTSDVVIHPLNDRMVGQDGNASRTLSTEARSIQSIDTSSDSFLSDHRRTKNGWMYSSAEFAISRGLIHMYKYERSHHSPSCALLTK